ncbi:MAG TPA: class I SAM-dependent methyltransferase [bacterium]|nr:class I SAM-dependent methyltransferase [bacterium]
MLGCPRCGLHWLDPRPRPESLPDLYRGYYTHESRAAEQASGKTGRLRDAILASRMGYLERRPSSAAWRVAGRLAGWIGPIRETVEMGVMRLPARTRGRLLDVGCGAGRFLLKMRSLGWDVAGVEVDSRAAAIARDRGLDVYEGGLEPGLVPSSSFDVITLNHVIEHVPDPVETIALCRHALRPSGRLVLTTPNTSSWGHRSLGDRWFHLDVPRHLFLFDPETLVACVTRAGLTVRDLRTVSRSASLVWAMRRARRGFRPPRGFPDRVGAFLFHGAEHAAVSLGLPVGEEVFLVAEHDPGAP